MVLAHDSYNSCCALSKLSGRMFPDSDVTKAFTLGKAKCRYTKLYGIAAKFKQKIIFDIPCFDESMKSELQMCQKDMGIRVWNNDWVLGEAHYYDSQFLRRPNVVNLLSCLTDSISFGQ